ncbi:MAG TPA: hypothetical protein DCQ83_01560 [Fibrobacteres bacterium]|nr:hypothetical protein [Fibrobacterota bacterium]
MSRVLLLDLDHTLYPSTVPTQTAVDAKITEYIRVHLNLPPNEADALRRDFCERYGTTLKGLEIAHGVDRERYCDFIQDLEDTLMPPPDPRMREWLSKTVMRLPTYLFTNARRDWADRCLLTMGLSDFHPDVRANEPSVGSLHGILDIGFMEWYGKPNAAAFIKAGNYIRNQHGDARLIFADDRLDNLDQAKAHGWTTVWVRPHDALSEAGSSHVTIDSLLELDVESIP